MNWISVRDRLPEDQVEVLVATRSKNGVRNIDKADVSARSSEKVRKLTAIAAYGGNMTIGQRIRMYREKKGKSRAAMENETGISAATIYHYEIDGMEPTASRIVWLADYFNVTADELLGRN